jgi:DNA-binding FadR family transcriptional regulator
MPTTAPKAAVGIANLLRRRIVTGEVPVGNALPSEMQLVDELDVSRPTLRAGLRILENEGLITVRRGSRGGAWVNAPTTDVLARRAGVLLEFRGATLDEVHQARILLEPTAARIVADRRDPDDIAALERALEHEAESEGDLARSRAATIDFHRILIELAGNRTLSLFASMLNEIIHAQARRHASPRHPERKGRPEHSALIACVRAGDGEGAARLWTQHLEQARHTLMRSVGANKVVDVMEDL